MLQDPTLNFLFGAQYQSTDESVWEDVVSENTDEETQAKRVTRLANRQAPWNSRPPTYRSEQVSCNKRQVYAAYLPM
jgi:hypothetical protein